MHTCHCLYHLTGHQHNDCRMAGFKHVFQDESLTLIGKTIGSDKTGDGTYHDSELYKTSNGCND